MKQLNLEDVSQRLLFDLEFNYGVNPDEELKQVYLLEDEQFIVITGKSAIIHTNLLNEIKTLNSVIPDEFELNRLGNLQVELETQPEPATLLHN